MAKLKLNIPVKRGDRLELDVETLASSGDGLCRHEGYTLFTPGGVPGDKVLGKVIKITPRFGVVDVLKRIELSKDRIDPPCPVFFKCGGCKFQDLNYEKQLQFKVQVVKDSLQRIAGLDTPENIKTIPADSGYEYRNKGSFAIQGKGGKPAIGFYAEGSHNIADSTTCDILLPAINDTKEWIRQLLIKHDISIYNESNYRGLLRGLIIRHSTSTGETLVGLVTYKGRFPRGFLTDLTQEKVLKQLGIVGMIQNTNLKNTNVILGNENRVLWGKNHFTEKLGELTFHLSLGSFFQIHSKQAEKLYSLISQWTEKAEDQTIIDAYSGSGGIALWLAKQGRNVIGIEKYEPAMEDAKLSAENNGLSNCQFLTGTVEEHAITLDKPIHTFIVDPPRKGCSEAVIQTLLKSKPKQIVYISCNPSTLARDLERLEGYKIEEIRVIDMFPQTQHIETAILATRL
ncbi:MAG: 23S rRNA (uracil(1939)-C(5))-methyltransferase RlmD [Nitrospina sp.]|jgi:23S rRNA (uracil1939-C5)-methyltransferase|nr:23S rRNA (uracil(1939)-C(5))-methyltransferase RlmD [Nitrospina sp.]MBT3511291.1 23S rRNA (uracil(1939)-C(5))-methyltransferase RlmD [Nitrospina sp.]MBT3875082.1 23S rRNA (uracil(1939)-C(5))-methyltransferase RlmD [Nitrospina sp.]MBT4047485.1 23S rRNA (uracil(1939)-C(5))-methyltransferase RlmD [Nitrospina sp.]MBT4558158.1 23S rRNA (uracil(1939)-C(5))-methyltransferase RlmD [Nitrospina sp.]